MDVRDRELDLIFEGNGFLYNMVRIMAGTLIEIGTGDREPESVTEVFLVISNKDIINSVFRYSWFQFAHVPYLLWKQARLVLTQSHR